MDHHRTDNKDHKLAQEIKEKTITALREEYPTLHMRFHLYVSYPPETSQALLYYSTIHAMEEYNLTESTQDENTIFNAEMNLYGKHLFETHERVKKQLTNS